MSKAEPQVAWQARPEAGGGSAVRVLILIARGLGRRALHWVLVPVVAYFFWSRAPERRASRAYLGRVFGRPARWTEVYRHFYCFARMTADRIFFLAGAEHKVPVTFVGGPEAQAVVDGGRCGIFLAAHFGSFEAARVLGAHFGGMDLRIVLDQGQNATSVRQAASLNPELADKVIDAGQPGVALGLAMGEALRGGAWIGFLADRYRPGDRTVTTEFLGQPATFPVGPYLIANTFKTPIICVFCRLTSTGYEVHCEVLSPEVTLSRAERERGLELLVERYVQRLEHHVRASPYAWFNFYDFWAPSS